MDFIDAVIFDFGFTLCSQKYFTNEMIEYPNIYKVYQENIFHKPEVIELWGKGNINYLDIAKMLKEKTGLEINKILGHMEEGCKNLLINKEVYDFALKMKEQGKAIYLVTVNMDVFSLFVVPNHKELSIFDKIVNSADYNTDDKNMLWPKIFENTSCNYKNTLLIEDGILNVEKYQRNGGLVYQYTTEEDFAAWKYTLKINQYDV